MQREVQIILESVNNKNFVGTIVHPNGNIAEALLREGLAKCVDWSLAIATEGPEKYRKAQAAAKESKLRQWKHYEGPTGETFLKQHMFMRGFFDGVLGLKSTSDKKTKHLVSIFIKCTYFLTL